RIGRVDRIGQRRTVHAFHLIARDTNESRILERLRARVSRARMDIGAPDPFGDDERTIAQMAIAGIEPPARVASSADERRVVSMSLEADGELEANRLTESRRLFINRVRDKATVVEPDD